MVPLSYVAATWQLSRHEQREARNQLLQSAREMKPIGIDSLHLSEPPQYTHVEINGDVTSEKAMWRRQVLNGIPGYTALRNIALEDGRRVTLALGWTASPTTTYRDSDIEFPIYGYVMYPETTGISPSDVPQGQTNYVSEIMQGTDFEFYVQSQRAPENLSRLGLPEIESGPHLGYVGQWILIGIASVVIYIVALRRIRKDYASAIKS